MIKYHFKLMAFLTIDKEWKMTSIYFKMLAMTRWETNNL